MASSDTYRTIKNASRGLYREKGSKFISMAHPVSEVSQVKQILGKTRKEHHEARHHCYAYILGDSGQVWRVSDDGEPSGTAGRQILGRIKSNKLTNVVVIVSRYFGGTLLGASGLVNAYKTAAESALSNAEIIEQAVIRTCEISYPWISMNDVMKIIKEEDINQQEQSFGTNCRIILQFRASAMERIRSRLERVDGLEFKLHPDG